MSTQSNANFLEAHILRRFTVIKKVGSGAYGHVWKVEQKGTRRVLALKKIFDAFQHATDAQRTYREIEILRQLDHPNIIKLYDSIRAENNKDVYLLFQYMEADLHNVIAEGILKDVHIRFILYQLAKALKYLHSAKLIHRDLKPSNILVNSNCAIKLCDFGLVRSLNAKQLGAVLTEGVATRWYRSPQVLLGSRSYSTPADVWSFGCIIYEILAQKPLFAGSCTMDQIEKICAFTGYPSEDDIASIQSEISRSLIKEMKAPTTSNPSAFLKDYHHAYVDLLTRMLVFNPKKRMTIDEILHHEVVKDFHKPQQETTCDKEVSTGIDDNKKVTVQEYRRLVYGINSVQPKPKALSSSLGAGSVSPKYTPVSSNKTTTTVTFSNGKTESRPDMAKKFSYDRVKPASQVNYEQSIKKQQFPQEKPLIKYARSATNITKPSDIQQQFNNQRPINYEIPNKEETDPIGSTQDPRSTNYLNYPKYSYSNKPNEPIKQFQNVPMGYNNMQNGSNGYIGGSWKGIKSPPASTVLTSNEIKQKVLQFRSAKFPIVQKVNGEAKGQFQEGKIEQK